MKHICIVGTVGLPANYGGWETLVDNLTRELRAKFRFTVFCSRNSYERRLASFNSAKLIYIPLKANGLQSVLYDAVSMISCLFLKPDVILILGVSGGWFFPVFRLIYSGKIVCNIDGLEWRRPKWGWFAKWFLRVCERLAVRNCDVVIGDNLAIVRYVKQEYARDAKFIAFGGSEDAGFGNIELRDGIRRGKFALNIARVEPENNTRMLIEACIEANVAVVVFGRWEINEYSRRIYRDYSSHPLCFLMDHCSDQAVLNCYRRSCVVYLHGHSVGGTNPSLIEAMSIGVPVFCFDVIFNRETTMDKGLFFSSKRSLVEMLEIIEETDLNNLGSVLRNVYEENYLWPVIASKYAEVCGFDDGKLHK